MEFLLSMNRNSLNSKELWLRNRTKGARNPMGFQVDQSYLRRHLQVLDQVRLFRSNNRNFQEIQPNTSNDSNEGHWIKDCMKINRKCSSAYTITRRVSDAIEKCNWRSMSMTSSLRLPLQMQVICHQQVQVQALLHVEGSWFYRSHCRSSNSHYKQARNCFRP